MVVLSTDDLDESIRFYTETLGMKLKFRDGAHYAALDGGSVTLALATAVDHPIPGQVVVGIKTTDVDAAAKAIEANGGGIVKGPYDDAHERRAVVYDHKGNGRDFTNSLNKLLPLRSANYFFGMGYGADTNGLSVQAGPRGAGATPVQYPFTLFQGADWGPQFAGIAPVTFNESTVPESGRAFDVNTEGMAHYGLVADFVEEVRIEGGEPALTALYNSAEAYLQMWERTLNR